MISASTSRRSLVAAALMVVAAATACTAEANDEPRSDGPLRIDQEPGEICLSAGQRRDAVQGHEVLSNDGDDAATITSVSLIEPRGLRFVDAYVVPLSGTYRIGSWSHWPPPKDAISNPGIEWSRRTPAAGSTIEPDSDRPSVKSSLLTHVSRENVSEESGFAGIRVDYTVGSKAYYAVSSIRLKLKNECF